MKADSQVALASSSARRIGPMAAQSCIKFSAGEAETVRNGWVTGATFNGAGGGNQPRNPLFEDGKRFGKIFGCT
jgi:hypothetical protein